jgi:hypothetical protein
MLKYIVQVHPVEAGRPNLFKVKKEELFADKNEAFHWIWDYNLEQQRVGKSIQAVYRGCVDTETGDLVEDAHRGLC